MKNRRVLLLSLALLFILSVPAFSSGGPGDPGRKGSGELRLGFGPGIPYYGSNGFGPAFLANYDHNIWQVGPGTISLGGQIATSFFWQNYTHQGESYRHRWSHVGVIFRSAYHYDWRVPGLDTYAGFGAGMLFSTFDNNGNESDKESFNLSFLPTAFVGISYFFNELIGINAECGYNFSYASIGISFRITK